MSNGPANSFFPSEKMTIAEELAVPSPVIFREWLQRLSGKGFLVAHSSALGYLWGVHPLKERCEAGFFLGVAVTVGSIDYYSLLVQGPGELSDVHWEEILRSVVYHGEAETDPDAALDALQSVLFERSDEWLGTRRRIIQAAIGASSNPARRSDYCLTSLRNLALEASREAVRERESPELSVVRRQAADHLRALYGEKVLVSARMRSKKGHDICSMWGLASWGENWRTREPLKDLEQVKRGLPIIMRTYAGKGIIEYATVLPSYIRMILEAYGAPLSTAQIASLIVARISPPLFRNPVSPEDEERQGENDGGGYLAGYTTLPTPEDVLVQKQLQQSFFGILSVRETQIFQLKEEGFSIDRIAERLACSKRTVNGDWKSICDKCRQVLGQVC